MRAGEQKAVLKSLSSVPNTLCSPVKAGEQKAVLKSLSSVPTEPRGNVNKNGTVLDAHICLCHCTLCNRIGIDHAGISSDDAFSFSIVRREDA